MKSFECCRFCVAPKRYPGCHAVCQEYLAKKAEYETRKAEYYKDELLSGAIFGTRARKVNNALKGYRGNKIRER